MTFANDEQRYRQRIEGSLIIAVPRSLYLYYILIRTRRSRAWTTTHYCLISGSPTVVIMIIKLSALGNGMLCLNGRITQKFFQRPT
jgi:hypothetical protein